jgi:hypothetical protein
VFPIGGKKYFKIEIESQWGATTINKKWNKYILPWAELKVARKKVSVLAQDFCDAYNIYICIYKQ